MKDIAGAVGFGKARGEPVPLCAVAGALRRNGMLVVAAVVVACTTLSLEACSSRTSITHSPTTLRSGPNEFKLTDSLAPRFRRQQIQITVAGRVREERLMYPSRIALVLEDGSEVVLSASVLQGASPAQDLTHPTASCARDVPDGCVIGFEDALRHEPVVAVRVNASRDVSINSIDWYDYSPN